MTDFTSPATGLKWRDDPIHGKCFFISPHYLTKMEGGILYEMAGDWANPAPAWQEFTDPNYLDAVINEVNDEYGLGQNSALVLSEWKGLMNGIPVRVRFDPVLCDYDATRPFYTAYNAAGEEDYLLSNYWTTGQVVMLKMQVLSSRGKTPPSELLPSSWAPSFKSMKLELDTSGFFDIKRVKNTSRRNMVVTVRGWDKTVKPTGSFSASLITLPVVNGKVTMPSFEIVRMSPRIRSVSGNNNQWYLELPASYITSVRDKIVVGMVMRTKPTSTAPEYRMVAIDELPVSEQIENELLRRRGTK